MPTVYELTADGRKPRYARNKKMALQAARAMASQWTAEVTIWRCTLTPGLLAKQMYVRLLNREDWCAQRTRQETITPAPPTLKTIADRVKGDNPSFDPSRPEGVLLDDDEDDEDEGSDLVEE